MTRSSFWKRGAVTAIATAFVMVIGLWRSTVVVDTPAFDFDPVMFMVGLLAGVFIVLVWGEAMGNGLMAFLDWMAR